MHRLDIADLENRSLKLSSGLYIKSSDSGQGPVGVGYFTSTNGGF